MLNYAMPIRFFTNRIGSAKISGLLLFFIALLVHLVWALAENTGFTLYDSSNTFVIGLLCCLILIGRLAAKGHFSYRLITLVCFWLMASLAATQVNLAFWPQATWWLVLIAVALRTMQRVENTTPVFFILLLAALTLTALSQLYLSNKLTSSAHYLLAAHLAKATVLICALMVSSVTSQIISPLVKQSLSGKETKRLLQAELVLLCSALIATACFILGYFYQLPVSPGFLMICVGAMHLCRLFYWAYVIRHCTFCLTNLSVWYLNLAYLLMAASLIMLGLSYFTNLIPFDLALHSIAISLICQTVLAIYISVNKQLIKPVPHSKLSRVWFVILPFTLNNPIFYQPNGTSIALPQIKSLAKVQVISSLSSRASI